MPRLLDRSPIFKDSSEVIVAGERVRIRADQIILWVTLTPRAVTSPNPSARPFPVILDTGYNHTFAIRERHLIAWVGLRPEGLAVNGHTRDRGQRVVLRDAKVWIHPNERGEREQLAHSTPHVISASHGVAVYPPGIDFPRLPILGLRAITDNELVLTVDGRTRAAALRTAWRWWPFA